MKVAFAVLFAFALLFSAEAALPFQQPLPEGGKNWVVLIAGSNTWGNYRHQADIYHAYQIVHRAGIPDEQIIVFHYDDIANNDENPHQGVVINAPTDNPTADNVYKNVPKNYVGADVNADNVLAVLQGKTGKTSGASTGGQLKSTSKDNVFVYFADHGGPGILGMPEGEAFLYADDLNKALKAMASANMFNQLTFYIEACESGSIFGGGNLPSNINVYGVTAANADESSWGYYCPGMTPAPPSEYNTCLGDLFSISWMENTDSVGTSQSLQTQYKTVKERTSHNGTYEQGSHVMQFGDTSFTDEELSEFVGDAGTAGEVKVYRDAAMSNWDADLAPLLKKPEELRKAITERVVVEERFKRIVREVMGGSAMDVRPKEFLVKDWQCYKGAIASLKKECGRLPEHGNKHLRYLLGLCNEGVPLEKIETGIARVCHN